MLGEFLQNAYHIKSHTKDYVGMNQYSKQLCGIFKETLGEYSDEFADALYLRAKAVFASAPKTDSQHPEIIEALKLLKTAKLIYINKPLTQTAKDL